jgi:hypothetical protein
LGQWFALILMSFHAENTDMFFQLKTPLAIFNRRNSAAQLPTLAKIYLRFLIGFEPGSQCKA